MKHHQQQKEGWQTSLVVILGITSVLGNFVIRRGGLTSELVVLLGEGLSGAKLRAWAITLGKELSSLASGQIGPRNQVFPLLVVHDPQGFSLRGRSNTAWAGAIRFGRAGAYGMTMPGPGGSNVVVGGGVAEAAGVEPLHRRFCDGEAEEEDLLRNTGRMLEPPLVCSTQSNIENRLTPIFYL